MDVYMGLTGEFVSLPPPPVPVAVAALFLPLEVGGLTMVWFTSVVFWSVLVVGDWSPLSLSGSVMAGNLLLM